MKPLFARPLSDTLPLVTNLIDQTFSKFLIVGCINLLCTMATIYLSITHLAFSNVEANMLGYAIGLTVSYLLNSRFTFRYKGDWKKSVVKFSTVFIVAYFANLLVVLVLVKFTGINDYFAHWFGIPIYTLIFYFGSRYFAFKADQSDYLSN